MLERIVVLSDIVSNFLYLNNNMEVIDDIYVFMLVGDIVKFVFCLVLLVIGVLGFFGNCFLFYFLCLKVNKVVF